MFRLVVLAAVLVCCLGAPRAPKKPRLPDTYIVGGENVDISSVPYQLSFEEYNRLICGASIIGANWALTAAHCTEGSSARNIRMRSGTSLSEEGGTVHQAVEIIQNENYDYWTLDFDISLVRVSVAFEVGPNSSPVEIAASNPIVGEDSVIAGWGTLHPGDSNIPKNLKWITIPIISWDDCQEAYEEDFGGITQRNICAGLLAEGGKDACQGDSGGALTVNGQQVGIVSWGYSCALPGYPTVYTSAPYFKDWIKTNSGI